MFNTIQIILLILAYILFRYTGNNTESTIVGVGIILYIAIVYNSTNNKKE